MSACGTQRTSEAPLRSPLIGYSGMASCRHFDPTVPNLTAAPVGISRLAIGASRERSRQVFLGGRL
jgi:hypothetical protein